MSKPLLLAVATTAPSPRTNGYALRVYHVLRELAGEWRILLVAPPAVVPAALGELLSNYVPVELNGRWTSLPSQFETGPLERTVERIVAAERPDAALLWPGTEFLGFAPGLPPPVADRIDCLTLAAWRGRHHATTGREWISALRTVYACAAYERRVVRGMYATVAAGEDDARTLRRLAGRRSVHTIPNGVVVPAEAGGSEGALPTVAFTGVLDYPPNVDAACHFAHAVWPGIRAAVPAARFVIAGRHPLHRVLALAGEPGIEVRADVPSMADVLREAWVAVAPMICGSGIKNKVLEAWAVGRPVAMTTLATNGLALTPAAQELVADDSATLGRVIIDLLRHPERRRQLGSHLRDHVQGRHRWRSAAEHLSALLRGARAARFPLGTVQPQDAARASL